MTPLEARHILTIVTATLGDARRNAEGNIVLDEAQAEQFRKDCYYKDDNRHPQEFKLAEIQGVESHDQRAAAAVSGYFCGMVTPPDNARIPIRIRKSGDGYVIHLDMLQQIAEPRRSSGQQWQH